MRRLHIDHLTVYRYRHPVVLLPHDLLLRPREGAHIRIETATLDIAPAAHSLRWRRDAYDNALAQVSFQEPARRLSIRSLVTLQNWQDRPLDFLVADTAVRYPFRYEAEESLALGAYLAPAFGQDRACVSAWLGKFWRPGLSVETYVLLDTVNRAVAQEFEYLSREQPGVRTPAETLREGSGSCRDLATLFIEACRCLGLAARFVSGYLYSPWHDSQGGATHAWSEVYLPGAGWIGFDNTSGLLVGPDHIPVAVNRHPEAAPPVAGAFLSPGAETPTMEISVRVVEL